MEWRKIPGFSRYSVSEIGQIKRDACPHCMTKERAVKLVLNDRGYYKATIVSDDGRNITRTVHTFVAMAFLGPRPKGKYICHNDGVSTNNHYLNLRYDTPAANMADAIKHGTHVMGQRHPHAKLDPEKVRAIRQMAQEGIKTQEEIGDIYGVSQRAVWQVIHRKRWRHVQ